MLLLLAYLSTLLSVFQYACRIVMSTYGHLKLWNQLCNISCQHFGGTKSMWIKCPKRNKIMRGVNEVSFNFNTGFWRILLDYKKINNYQIICVVKSSFFRAQCIEFRIPHHKQKLMDDQMTLQCWTIKWQRTKSHNN